MIQTIRDFRYAQRFEPFDIELSSGRILHVETPDHVAYTGAGSGRIAVLNDNGTSLIVSALHIVNVGHFPPVSPV
jgi:hypothetical protein